MSCMQNPIKIINEIAFRLQQTNSELWCNKSYFQQFEYFKILNWSNVYAVNSPTKFIDISSVSSSEQADQSVMECFVVDWTTHWNKRIVKSINKSICGLECDALVLAMKWCINWTNSGWHIQPDSFANPSALSVASSI